MSNVRAARHEDLPGINHVSGFLGYAASSLEESRNRLEAILRSEVDELWVYEHNDEIRGWIHAFVATRLASPSFVEIGGLVVDGEYRRQGIGRDLVQAAVDWSRREQLSLRVRCNSKRDGANLFYKNLGFENSKSQIVHALH